MPTGKGPKQPFWRQHSAGGGPPLRPQSVSLSTAASGTWRGAALWSEGRAWDIHGKWMAMGSSWSKNAKTRLAGLPQGIRIRHQDSSRSQGYTRTPALLTPGRWNPARCNSVSEFYARLRLGHCTATTPGRQALGPHTSRANNRHELAGKCGKNGLPVSMAGCSGIPGACSHSDAGHS